MWGAAHAQTLTLMDYYYPRQQGATWLYQGYDWNWDTTSIKVIVADTAWDLNFYTGAYNPIKFYNRSVLRLKYESTVYGVINFNSKVYDDWYDYVGLAAPFTYYGHDDDLGADGDRIDGGCALPASVVVGNTYSPTADYYYNGAYQGVYAHSVQVLDVFPVTVPAGTFADCVHLRISPTFDGMPFDPTDEWWARGVGMVKMQGVGIDNAAVLRELVSCSSPVIAPMLKSANENAQSYEVAITTGGAWTAAESLDWISLSPASGSGSGTVTVTLAQNLTGTARQGLVVIAGTGHWVMQNSVVLPAAPGASQGPEIGISGVGMNFTVQSSVVGHKYQLQYSDTMAAGTWQDLEAAHVGNGSPLVIATPYDPTAPKRYYRLKLLYSAAAAAAAPANFALIPGGFFLMGNALAATRDGSFPEMPVHDVYVSPFFMAKHEVTNALWDDVRMWGSTHDYPDLAAGSTFGTGNVNKGPAHPVYGIDWYDAVKWCNARSQMEGLTPCYYTNSAQTSLYQRGKINIDNTMVKWNATGYRLPTEAEWEKAARGGLNGKRFPLGDTISHATANYMADNTYSYDTTYEPGYSGGPYESSCHPTYKVNGTPYTAPVGSFAANGYGLYDMSGNLSEWCWDSYSSSYYASSPGNDPRGPATSSLDRVHRGGNWDSQVPLLRVAHREYGPYNNPFLGFRCVRGVVP